MSYKNELLQKVERYKAFFNDTTPGSILPLVVPHTYEVPCPETKPFEKPLNEWDFDREADRYVGIQVKRLRHFISYTKEVGCDFIPSLTPFLGISLQSAYLSGGDVVFGKDTSWAHPCIHEWTDLSTLKLCAENRWYRLLRRMAERMMELCEGDYIINTSLHFAPLDMANALRGNQLFYDFYDHPEEVHRLMEISTDAIIWLQRKLREVAGLAVDGSGIAGMWLPGDVIYMSEDAPDLCSPEIYREFGFPYSQKVIDAIGGAFIHHHAKGWHVHGDIGKLRGLKSLEMSWDPNCPRPIDHIEEIYGMNPGLPLMTRCTAGDIYEKIKEIKRGRAILMIMVDSIREAKDVVAFVRKHSRI